MSTPLAFSVLLAVLAICCALAVDEDFAFDVSGDTVDLPPDAPKKIWGMTDISATVGRVFHLTIPKDSLSDSAKQYEAKIDQEQPLPTWLLFDKTGGIFWGVPLEEDVGVLHISVKAVRQSNPYTDEFTLIVNKNNGEPEGIDKCPSAEDSTILTLIIDKDVKAIKPKQRIIAINNIAKFLGLPYNAFILKPQLHPDDITDSSVILAGPGSLTTRTSKLASLIQVTVGCEGRLWLNSAPMIHQLKQQARDGTISEVLRLPLVGWRVKTEIRPLLREKRHDDNYAGSGDDYEEYYEYDDYDDPDKDVDGSISSSTQTATTNIATTHAAVHSIIYDHTTIPVDTETHPHRHHHGEIQAIDDETDIDLDEDPDLETEHTGSTHGLKTEETEIQSSPQQPSSTTLQTTTAKSTTTPITSVAHTEETKSENVTPVSGLYKPSETLDSDDEYDDEYDDDDTEEPITEIPYTRNEIITNERGRIFTETVVDTEPTPIDTVTTKAETQTVENIPETTPLIRITTTDEPKTSSSTTTTNPSTTTTTATTTTEETVLPTTTTESDEIPTSYTTTTTTEKPTTVEDSTTPKHTTTVRQISPVSTPKPTMQHVVTETIEYDVKNFAPTIQIRFNRIPVTAGKYFSQIVPENMFTDMEDGNKLTLEFLDNDRKPVNKSSWCQFNSLTREIYGLPLEEDVSRWEFYLKATDNEGASVSELVEIIVQRHKFWRVFNHEFSLQARVEKKQDFQYPVDWALHILRGIGNILHTTNTSEVTVRSVNYATDPIIFTWTNDSLATNYCPKSEIEQLFGLLTANNEGDPSIALNRSLAPELRAKKVTQHLTGVCEEIKVPHPTTPTTQHPITSHPNVPPIILPPSNPVVILPSNLAPILRNPVDHLKAAVGELFLFQVPYDTFYDPEDVDPQNLKLQLFTADRQPIPADHWLQFDSKNREFYGIPTQRDTRRAEYQLVCEDTGGLKASDTLVVEIIPVSKMNYNVEFSMTIESDYHVFVTSPLLKRKFVEKVLELFHDENRDNFQLSTISKGSALAKDPTIVTWYNKSLTHDECPWNEIKELESILVNSERIISNRVHKIMGDDFPVAAVRLQNIGVCKTVTAVTTKIQVQDAVIPIDESVPQESHDEYLITFIVPAVIISAMLLLAGIAACVLYRRRRSGKMNIEEDGRQSYGNKGIPVIFQEELDEKPEPGNKAPVILKDEKPPLAPPEYSKSGSLKMTADDSEPYQPPPPFTRTQDNGRQPRPKPTPTYRKPPPYVPP